MLSLKVLIIACGLIPLGRTAPEGGEEIDQDVPDLPDLPFPMEAGGGLEPMPDMELEPEIDLQNFYNVGSGRTVGLPGEEEESTEEETTEGETTTTTSSTSSAPAAAAVSTAAAAAAPTPPAPASTADAATTAAPGASSAQSGAADLAKSAAKSADDIAKAAAGAFQAERAGALLIPAVSCVVGFWLVA